jgi:hypothetical protein
MWSVDLMAGIVEPNTDTGVADGPKDLHDGDVVGCDTSLVTVGLTSISGCCVPLQDGIEIIKMMRIVNNTNRFMDLLFYRFLKLFKRCHARNCSYKVS